jgi:hypothetical protein
LKDLEETLPLNRRLFVSRMGAFGLGAVGASTFLAACGSNNNRQTNTGGGLGQLAVDPHSFAQRFADIRLDENNHVDFLKSVLGGAARPAPTFDTTQAVWNPTDITQFVNLADALENTGTGAYLYAVKAPALLANPGTLQLAGGIALVEGRHAGFLNALTNRPLLTDPNPALSPLDSVRPQMAPYSSSIEVPQPPSEVLARATPFIKNINLNGGPPPPASDDLSGASVNDILNYALLLEYLERDWYNKNVQTFIGV